MTINFDKLKDFPAYRDMPLTRRELSSDSITEETWQLTEAFYRQKAMVAPPEVQEVSYDAKPMSFAEAAEEVANKSEEGERLVRAYKGQLRFMRKQIEEDGNV